MQPENITISSDTTLMMLQLLLLPFSQTESMCLSPSTAPRILWWQLQTRLLTLRLPIRPELSLRTGCTAHTQHAATYSLNSCSSTSSQGSHSKLLQELNPETMSMSMASASSLLQAVNSRLWALTEVLQTSLPTRLSSNSRRNP